MLRSILNRHRTIGLAGETHYFDDLRERYDDPRAPLDEADGVHCADYFRSLDVRPYGMQGDPGCSSLNRRDIISRAGEAGGRPDDYLEAYCRLTAERTGKHIWGEKTPRHVFRIKDILDSFPQAKVICMVRDPRGVVASYRHWRNQGGLGAEGDDDYRRAIAEEESRARKSYNIVIATLLWRASVNAARSSQAALGPERVRIQRYEDIIEAPEESVQAICTWLGLDYDPDMLTIPMHNSSFTAYRAESGVSQVPLERWRTTLPGQDIAVVERIAGGCLADAGYAADSVGVNRVRYALEWLKAGPAAARAGFANRNRIGRLGPYVWRRLLLAWQPRA